MAPRAFLTLIAALNPAVTLPRPAAAQRRGHPAEPVPLTVANRLFGQTGFEFRPPFLALAADLYGAPLRPLDFATKTVGANIQVVRRTQWIRLP